MNDMTWFPRTATALLLFAGCSRNEAVREDVPDKGQSLVYSPARIEIHRAELQPREGFVEMQTRRGTRAFVDPMPSLTIKDISETHLEISEGWPALLRLKFTTAGQQKLKALSLEHQGKPMAIFIEGVLRGTPTVPTSQWDFRHGISIGGVFSPEETQDLIQKAEGQPKTDR
jgi:hypothetical protein